MDYRCPVCREIIPKRRLSETVMLKLEIECPRCKSVVRHNIHRVENTIVLSNFAAIIAAAAFAYWFQSRDLALVAFGVAMLGAAALPVLERTYLRSWPRYVAIDQQTDP